MIEFACHTWTFSDLLLPEALGTIARLGFRRVDLGSGRGLNLAQAAQQPRAIADEVRADLLRYNLSVSDVYPMLPHISLRQDDRREKSIALFKALIPFFRAVGAEGVTISPGVAASAQGDEEDDAEAAAFDRAIDALRNMTAAATTAGLRVSIEPHVDSVAATPEAALQMLDAVEGLELTLDWAQMVYQNVKHEAILDLLPRTRHIQLRQAARNQMQTSFDKGKIDLAVVLNDVIDAGYTGTISVEIMTVTGRYGIKKVDALREAVQTRDALRDARSSILKSNLETKAK